MKIKRKKINRTFGFKSSKRAVNYEKAAKKKHRNLTPFFTQNLQSREFAYTTWFFLQRCETHNFNKNPYLNALRLSKYQREAIRRERRETDFSQRQRRLATCADRVGGKRTKTRFKNVAFNV